MLIPYTKIIGSPIYELKTSAYAGNVSEVIFDFDELKIAGLLVKKNKIFTKKNYAISAVNIVELSTNDPAVIIDNEDNLEELKELVRLNKKYQNGEFGIGQKVETKSGKYIGKVFDILFDTESLEIKKFYVKSLMSERIITVHIIISVNTKKIVIKDDFEAVKIRAVAPSVI